MGTEKHRQALGALLAVYCIAEKDLQIGEYFITVFQDISVSVVLIKGVSNCSS